MNRMMQFMPIMIGIFAWSFSSGAVIYWVASSIFSAVQQYFITGWGSLPEILNFFIKKEKNDRGLVPKVIEDNTQKGRGFFGFLSTKQEKISDDEKEHKSSLSK